MRTLNDYFLECHLDDVSTASSTVRVAVPDAGKVIKITSVLGGTISEVTLE